jgi:HK97 family phage major capsid protein
MENKEIVNDIKEKIDSFQSVAAGKVDKDYFDSRIQDLEQKFSSMTIPQTNPKDSAVKKIVEDLKSNKSISNLTENGAGNVEVVSEIVRGLTSKGLIAPKVRIFYGDNARTNIPVFDPGLAMPSGVNYGDESTTASTAALNPVTLTPYPFISLLPVDRLALYTTSIESSLVDIFGDAFGQSWDNQILNGTGSYQFTGIYNSTWITSVSTAYSGNVKTAASATAVTWKELQSLARTASAVGPSGNMAMIMHPDVINSVITATGASPAAEIEYLGKGTIAGVPVILSNWAPNTMTTGKYVAVACDLSKYAAAFVRDIIVDPIKVKGSAYVYEQASVYANGAPLSKSAFFYLKLA